MQSTCYFNPSDFAFTTSPSTIMHIDLNSCFASIEQQANPLLRKKPVAVAAYTTPGGCIIAPSVEAKRQGVKVGMRVRDGRSICRNLVVLEPDPWKYRFVNRKLLLLFRNYTPKLSVKSIDEMVLDFSHLSPNRSCQASPRRRPKDSSKALQGRDRCGEDDSLQICQVSKKIWKIAQEIKIRIKKEVGDWLTVSVGVAPNRFLAKLGAGLNKPDGLDEINHLNFKKVYTRLKLDDLCGIKINNTARLNSAGIYSVLDMYRASVGKLKSAFRSILGYYWYLRLRGYEVDDVHWSRKSFGQSYALYKATADRKELSKLLCHLVTKMARRLRFAGYSARGVHVSCLYTDYSFWHHGHSFSEKMYATNDLYKRALGILHSSPKKKVRNLAVSCFSLEKSSLNQLTLFDKEQKKRNLTSACDRVWDRWGNFSVISAAMLGTTNKILDRIAFGGIKELEEFVFKETIEDSHRKGTVLSQAR